MFVACVATDHYIYFRRSCFEWIEEAHTKKPSNVFPKTNLAATWHPLASRGRDFRGSVPRVGAAHRQHFPLLRTHRGESHLCAEAAGARAFVASTRVVEPCRDRESEKVRFLRPSKNSVLTSSCD
jgi:hypothetical protein